MTHDRKRWIFPVVLVGLAILYPYAGASRYALHLGMLFFLWATVASYWNLLAGYAGFLSLGNMGFMAMGAYISAVTAKEVGLPPVAAIPLAGVVSTLIVLIVVGLPVTRLRGIYAALLTLVFADALPSVISLLRGWTGGGVGLLGIPTVIPDLEKWQAYYFALALCVVAHVLLHRVLRGDLGLAFVALRDGEDLAVSLGVDRFVVSMKALAISAFVTAIAGALYAHLLGEISPAMLGVEQFLMVVAMWMLGGVGTFAGPIVGAAIFTLGGEYLRTLGTLRLGLVGGLLMLTVLFFPGGIMDLVGRVGRAMTGAWRGRREDAAPRSHAAVSDGEVAPHPGQD